MTSHVAFEMHPSSPQLVRGAVLPPMLPVPRGSLPSPSAYGLAWPAPHGPLVRHPPSLKRAAVRHVRLPTWRRCNREDLPAGQQRLAESTRMPGRLWPLGMRTSLGVAALVTGFAFLLAVRSKPAAAAAGEKLVVALTALFEFYQTAGWVGVACHVVGFSLWVSLSLPTTLVEITTGFVFGPLTGFATCIVCKTVGALIAFLAVRSLRQHFGWKMPSSLLPKLEALRSRPLLTMVGVRFAPLPLGVKNYGLALCEVDFKAYMVASIMVNVPFSVLWATAGGSCHSIAEALAGPSSSFRKQPLLLLLLGAGLLAMLALRLRRRWSRPVPN
mmetsp:Transcript_45693/g.146662  ORF Transcript_45693/g.146662 Transcript_45693/m.146662 type:complete len:329 (-) Transcript_45693:50-1036(-)